MDIGHLPGKRLLLYVKRMFGALTSAMEF